MAKDKSFTHQTILKVAREQFIKYGYSQTSIRTIAKLSGVTSAALYKHAVDKEDLFSQIVSPFVDSYKKARKSHIQKNVEALHKNTASPVSKSPDTSNQNFDSGFNILQEIVLPYREEIKLICNKAQGTKYENFFHEAINKDVDDTYNSLMSLKKEGKKINVLTKKELHVLISAYYTASLEPILHDYTTEETMRCFKLTIDSFMPGWLKIIGY